MEKGLRALAEERIRRGVPTPREMLEHTVGIEEDMAYVCGFHLADSVPWTGVARARFSGRK
jgi:hypothetical protein